MMHLRSLALFLCFLPGGARRSIRVVGSYHGAQKQNDTLANSLEVSAEAREALVPRFRFGFGPHRTAVRMQAGTGLSLMLGDTSADPGAGNYGRLSDKLKQTDIERRARAQEVVMAEPDAGDAQFAKELDAVIRRELNAASPGVEERLANNDEEALALFTSQVLQKLADDGEFDKVLQKLDDDGRLLSRNMASRINEVAALQRVELLKTYDEQLGGLQKDMAKDRDRVRAEMENIQTLKSELRRAGVLEFDRDKIVSSLALLVGLVGSGSALTEALKLAMGYPGGDPLTLGLNGALGAAGVLYHFQRSG